MSDNLLWGSTRPRFRLSTSSTQTNGTNYVLNQPPVDVNISFPKEIILSESVLDGHLVEDIIGYRGIFDFTWDYLDRASCERLIDIFNSSDDIYLRPYFNFWKEYKVRCSNAWELERMSSVTTQPYKGSLTFETLSLESSVPSESSGSFNFDGSTKVTYDSGISWITGNCSIDMWIKTPSSFGSVKLLAALGSTDNTAFPYWRIRLKADGSIRFHTYENGSTHDLDTTDTLSTSTWYHITIVRKNTDDKYIFVDNSTWASGSDLFSRNDIQQAQLADTTSDFDGLCQIFRIFDVGFGSGWLERLMTEIRASNIQLWWDFSQGSAIGGSTATDLSGNSADGTVSGTASGTEESFPDKVYKILS